MNTLSILSKDAEHYLSLFSEAQLTNLTVHAFRDFDNQPEVRNSTVLFGNPNLIAHAIQQGAQPCWVQSSWAGNQPLMTLTDKTFQLTGVKGVFGQAMCEYVFTYLLHFCRNVNGFDSAQQQRSWAKTSYTTLQGKTLGIMGVGDIGQAVAKMATQWGMRVVGLTRTTTEIEHVERCFSTNDKLEFAQQLDYLVCLLPDTPATLHLIDTAFIQQLPNHCVLINAGRGSVIDDNAFIDAMRDNRLKAAVLDVFTQEPLPESHPYWALNNVIVTQHTAAESTPEMIAPIFIENYQRFISGKPLRYLIDFTRGY